MELHFDLNKLYHVQEGHGDQLHLPILKMLTDCFDLAVSMNSSKWIIQDQLSFVYHLILWCHLFEMGLDSATEHLFWILSVF